MIIFQFKLQMLELTLLVLTAVTFAIADRRVYEIQNGAFAVRGFYVEVKEPLHFRQLGEPDKGQPLKKCQTETGCKGREGQVKSKTSGMTYSY